MKSVVASLFIVFAAMSCQGYHSMNRPLALAGGSRATIDVSMIPGDIDGALRTAMIQSLAESGSFVYAPGNSQYLLDVKITGNSKEKIGFKWDQHPISGKLQNRLVPNEGRRTIQVSATLIDRRTKKKVKGPIQVSGYSDYDYVNPNSLENLTIDPNTGNQQSILAYSLGQLGSEEEASSMATFPAFQMVAKKATDYFRLALVS